MRANSKIKLLTSMAGNTRARWHDYTSRKIYLITLKKQPGVASFGSIEGDWRLPAGIPGCSYIKASSVGWAIKNCLRQLSTIHPHLKLYQYALMPDHLHLIISVEGEIDEILGRKIAIFKVMVNNAAGIKRVFQPGFNDQIVTPRRSLDVIYSYLRDNPRRLAVKKANPDYFRRINSLEINGNKYQSFGNIHLLDNPFKDLVVVHRKDTHEQFQENKERWLYTGANGGVLVTPFISKREKEVRREAEAAGGRIILITHKAFPERFKPAAYYFYLCSEGRLLIITLGLPSNTPLTRLVCERMNALAKDLEEGL